MAAPPKPWEVGGANNRMNSIPGIQNVTDSNRLQSSDPASVNPTVSYGTPSNVRRVIRPVAVPALPPRPSRLLTRPSYIPNTQYGYSSPYSYGSYGSNYGSYSGLGMFGNSYGGFGSYGGYGMNRYGYNPTGNGPESRFIQMAEESSRPAFQSIESLVQAFGSVSFMLESTFNAVYGSFRAVLSVAENFGRLRSLFGQLFSTFAILRTLQWLYMKLLYLLGLRSVNPQREAIWQQAAANIGEFGTEMDPKEARSSWPIIMFMGIMFSGPYLVWKLVSSLSNLQSLNPHDPNDWKKSKDPTCTAVALYDFAAESNQELNLRAGQTVMVAPRELQPKDTRGWILATGNGKHVGLVPYNYLRLISSSTAVQNVQGGEGTFHTSQLPQNQGMYMQSGQMIFTQPGTTGIPEHHIPVINHQQYGNMMPNRYVPASAGLQGPPGLVPQVSVPTAQTDSAPQDVVPTPKEPENNT